MAANHTALRVERQDLFEDQLRASNTRSVRRASGLVLARYSSTIEDAGQQHLSDLPIILVCLPALLLRYPMRELDPPGRRGDIAAQQTGGNKKSDSDVKRTIQAARHGQFDQPQDKNDRDRRSPEGRKKGGVTGSKK